MSNLSPTGPPQPPLNASYETPSNPATTEPAQDAAASHHAHEPRTNQTRIPPSQTTSPSEAHPTSLASGIRGAPPGEETHGLSAEDAARHLSDLDGEQMRASGEGDVAAAVRGGEYGKIGAGGAQADLAADLDQKKAEQAPMREAIQEGRRREVDVGGVLGQRGGPANPVDGKGNYPNSGD